MSIKCGLVGLPNAGKSTIFNALTKGQAACADYPFCTIEPNVGIVNVPDDRLNTIAKYIPTQKIIPAILQMVDIAGLVEGASRGEGLGNKFLGHIRNTNAIAHVVRCFDNNDPLRDIDIVQTELIFADHATVQKNIERQRKLNKSGGDATALNMLENLEQHLQNLQPARTFKVPEKAALTYRDLHLISAKPVLYVCNIAEDDINTHSEAAAKIQALADREGAATVQLSGKIEAELTAMDADSRAEMLEAFNMQSKIGELIRQAYKLLKLHNYFTAGEKEIRAWTISMGCKAPAAAGVIHSDFERGFICAEVYTVPDLVSAEQKSKLKEKGLLRLEGRDYEVKDGDIMEFRVNP